jgi:hypothetical protein
MYIQSKTKDVVFTVVAGMLLLALALTWNSRSHLIVELDVCRFTLKNCESDLKREKENIERLRDQVLSEQQLARDNTYALSKKAIPIIEKFNDFIEMMDRRLKNGELSKSIMDEYAQIFKR